MLVSAVSSNKLNKQSFGHHQNSEDIESYARVIANMDDATVRSLSYAAASHQVNDKRYNRARKLAFISIPLAGAVAGAINATKTSRIGRVAGAAWGFAEWALPLVTGAIVFKASNKIEKSSKKARDFNRNHPVMSYLTKIGVAVGTILGITFGTNKLIERYGVKLTDKFAPEILKFADKLDGNSVLNFAQKQLNKLPEFVRELGKAFADWSPWMILAGSFAHSLSHSAKRDAAYAHNYAEFKASQTQLRDYFDIKEHLEKV
ncbi:hypothetical protein IJ579_09545 [bacterium]|nr:hypothetical protein [bacterium]